MDTDALTKMIDTYCAAWGEDDPARRETLLQDVWAERATYTDPLGHVEGRQNLVAHIGEFRSEGLGIVLALTLSTALAIAVGALVFVAVARMTGNSEK